MHHFIVLFKAYLAISDQVVDNKFCLLPQDRAKSAPIIVVGCHASGVSDRMRRTITNYVKDYCKRSLPFYPEIVAVSFVTVQKLEEDIVQLCKCLYDTACDRKMSLG